MSPPTADPRATLDRFAPAGIQLGLERPRRLLAALGSPERGFPAILIAGTNGKGSTAALISSMIEQAGYRSGLYTSPPLESLEEQIQTAGRPIPRDRLGELLEEIGSVAEACWGGVPTPFEAMTAAALLHFGAEMVDLAVIEAGMGGARDATNLCRPIASLITSVSLEHGKWMGGTVEAIAREKAGVFRPGCPALARAGTTAAPGGPRSPEDPLTRRIRAVLEAEAEALGSEFHWLPDEVSLRVEPPPSPQGPGQRVRLRTPRGAYRVDLALSGLHQAWNLALAVRAAESLAQRGWLLDEDTISAGAAACRWPGRLEPMELADGGRVLLDCAHNPEGALALATFLEGSGEAYDLLFGVLDDKDAGTMLGTLAGGARRVLLTRPPGPRGREPAELVELVPAGPEVVVEPEPAAALERARSRPCARIVICGSVALVGELRRRLRQLGG